MENNHRQGCRWIEFSERLPKPKVDVVIKEYSGVLDIGFYSDKDGMVHTESDLGPLSINQCYWLDESIEPCATSSENYWKQRCEAAERVSFNYMEQLKAAEAYAYMAFSKITGVMSGDEEKLFNEW